LNAALLENGVSSQERRKSICAAFLFQFAYHQDAGWLLEDGLKLFPLVAFAERDDASRENLGSITKLHVPTPVSSWHEYAHGIVSQFFEDDSESTGDLRFGSYNVGN
jgi:predicted oxidoreductase